MLIQKTQLVQCLFNTFLSIQRKMQNSSQLFQIITFLDFTFLILAIILEIIQPFYSTESIPQAFSHIWNILAEKQIINAFIYTNLAAAVFLIGSFIVQIILMRKLEQTQVRQYLKGNKFSSVLVCSILIYELSLIPAYCALTQNMKIVNETVQSLSSLSFIICYSLYVFIFTQRKIYSFWLPLLLGIKWLNKNSTFGLDYEYFALVSISLYFKQKQVHKCGYLIVFLLQILAIFNSTYSGYTNQIQILSIFIIIAATILIGLMNFLFRVTPFHKEQLIKFYLNVYDILSQIKQKTKFEVCIEDYFCLFSLLQKSKQITMTKQQQSIKINQQNVELWIKQFINILDQQINHTQNIEIKILRIKVKGLLNNSIFSCLKMLEEINLSASNYSLRERFILYSFSAEQVDQFNFKSSNTELIQIKKLNQIQSNIESICFSFLDSSVRYLEYLSSRNIQQERLFQHMVELFEKQQYVSKCLKLFVDSQQLSQERLMLQYLLKCYNPSYQMPSYNKNRKQHFENIMASRVEFLELENQKIVNISQNLCNKLDYSKISLILQHQQYLLPYFDKNILDKDENKKMIIPLKKRNGQIVIFKGEITLIQKFEGQIRYFVSLASDQKSKYPCVIININYPSITFMSTNFVKYFRDGQKSEEFNVFLACLAERIAVEESRSKQSQFYVQIQKYSMKVIKLKQYHLSNNRLILYQINVQERLMMRSNLTIFIQKSRQADQDQQQQNLQIKYQNQQHFCRITNPKKNLVNQKILRLQDKLENLTHHRITIIFKVIIFTLVACFSIMIVLISINCNTTLNNLNKLKDTNTAQTNILDIYFKSLVLYQMNVNNQTHQNIYLKNNTNILNIYQSQINLLVHQINIFYNSYHAEGYIQPLEIYFGSYTVQTNTGQLVLIDFLQEILIFLSTKNPQFLINNYGSIETFYDSIDILQLIQAIILQENDSIFYLISSFTLIYVVLLMLIYWQIYQSEEKLNCIKKVILNLNDQVINRKIELVSHFKKVIEQNQDIYIDRQNKKLDRITKSVITMKNIKKEIQLALQSMDKQTISTSHILKRPQSKIRNKIQKQLLKTFSLKQIQLRNFLDIFLDQIYHLIIFLMVLGCFSFIYIQSANISQEKILLLQYQDNYYESYLGMIKKSISFYQNSISISIGHWSDEQEFQLQLKTEFQKSLPAYFEQFKLFQATILSQNICELSSNSDKALRLNYSICLEVLDGILINGYRESHAHFQELIITALKNNQSVFQISQTSISMAQQFLFAQQVLQDQIYFLIETFLDQSLSYINSQKSSLLFKSILLITILTILIVIIFTLCIRKLRLRYKLYVKAFSTLPKDYILNIHVMKYINKHQLLDYIDKI